MSLKLRKALKKDWDYILSLRNDPVAYRNFYHQKKKIPKKEHYTYMKKQEKNRNFTHWIITENNENVGYARILDEDVGIIVEKNFRNHGIAKKSLKLIEKEAKKLKIKKLIAKILVENKASERIFQKNGYKLRALWYEKQIK